MAHFARIENGIVQAVHLVDNAWLDSNDEQKSGSDFLNTLFNIKVDWVQTSYNGNIRKQYCGIGYSYKADADVFVAPQPFPSWTLDDNHDWQPPVAKPLEDKMHQWDEATTSWNEITALQCLY